MLGEEHPIQCKIQEWAGTQLSLSKSYLGLQLSYFYYTLYGLFS